jgi:uncharacterized protein YdeI (YjbR/CyaY-like superfamily)
MPASPQTLRSFLAVLEPDRTRLRWVIARIPFDIAKTWPVRRGLRVRGEIEGFGFRTSLFPDPRGDGHILLVNKKMQAAAGAGVGSRVRIVLAPDMEERPTHIPPELAQALKGDRRLRPWFDKLSPSMRREIAAWASEPKSAAGRQKRAAGIAERLLLTLEGEKELPPLLHAAFLRQPLARKGWETMTAVQRRNHLLAIYYYQSAEARERRAAKVVEEALRVAKKRISRAQ